MTRTLLTIVLSSSLFIACNVRASGFLPYPIVTNDPSGDIDPKTFYKIACELYDQRFADGEKLEGTLGGVVMHDDTDTYRYYYYLQDVLDTCVAMRDI